MTRAEIEKQVALYLDRRDADPSLTPESFAAEHAGQAEPLLAAIRAALEMGELMACAALEHPTVIGPYRVVREIGRGGFGVVFEVEDPAGVRRALKLLPPAAVIGPKALERFRREVEVLSNLDHPAIVPVCGSGTHAGSPYLVMALVEGETLNRCCGRVEPRRAAEIVRDLARALESAHARGILHRDLKPHNAILQPDGRVVLVDFGLVALEGEGSLTSTGAVLGTPRYMSPEQALGARCDERSDVYGLGAVLYELLVGRPAYAQSSRAQVLDSVIAGRFERPRAVRPDLPVPLERVTLQSLAWEPRRRYASAADMARDLERFLAGERVLARPPGRSARLARSLRANPGRSIALAALSIATLSGLGWGLETWAARRNEQRRRFEDGRDRALTSWILGNPARARRELAQAAVADPDDAECRALLALIEAGDRGVADAGSEALLAAADRGALSTVLRCRRLRGDGQTIQASQLLLERSAALPRSAALRAEFAAVLDEQGRVDEAVRFCAEAIALEPQSPELREWMSDLLFSRGEVGAAVEHAHAGAALAFAAGEGSPTRLFAILRRAPDAAVVREELRARLAIDPARNDTRFALAVSYDTDHLLREARREYEAVLEHDPRHAAATLYLANLRLGADRGRCRSCDESFQLAPEVLDRAEGTRLLVRAIDLDRGQDEGLLRAITAIAVVQQLLDPVAQAFESVLARAPADPVATRIAAALDRLRQAGSSH